MNAKFELEVIPQNTLVNAFETETGIKAIVNDIKTQAKEQVTNVVWDLSKKKDRDAIASLARKVASSKTAIDAAGKQLKEQYTVVTNKIDADRKFARDELDLVRDEIRKPLTDWENAEKERKAKHEQDISDIKTMLIEVNEQALSSLQIKHYIECLDLVVVDSTFEEYEQEAKLAKFETLEALRATLSEREKYEAEQAELERQRIAEQEQLQCEREEQIAREAAERATREAEEKARLEAERVQREQIEAAEREARLKAEKEAAELRAKQAAENERKRIEAEQAAKAEAERKAEEARLADLEHRQKIHREAANGIRNLCIGISEAQMKDLVLAIRDGKIPHISIKY